MGYKHRENKEAQKKAQIHCGVKPDIFKTTESPILEERKQQLRFVAKLTRICVLMLEGTDFGQSRFGHPDLANFG